MGNYFINKCERSLNSIVPKINRLKKFPENTELLFYKEVNYDHIKKIDLNTYTEIENGDIICFQKQLTPSEWVFVYYEILLINIIYFFLFEVRNKLKKLYIFIII